MSNSFTRSFDLIKYSAIVLRAQRQLLLFPVIAGVAMTAIALSFFVPLLYSGGFERIADDGSGMAYSFTFLLYVISYFITFYFNTALVACVMLHFDGHTPTLRDGFKAANSRFGSILGYAVIAATVGMILRAIQERVPFAGRLIIAFIGAGWSIASFLVVPVLVAKDAGPIDAVRQSAALMKRTWGENVVGQASMGVAFTVIYLLVVICGAVLTAVFSETGLSVLVIPVLVLTFMAMLGVVLTHTALTGIYAASLYRFAEGESGGGFDDDTLRAAFLPK